MKTGWQFGFIVIAISVIAVAAGAQKVGAGEIWYRLPKFILGFFAASLVASFIVKPLAGCLSGKLFPIPVLN